MLHIWMEQNVLFYGMIGAGILGILCMFMVDRFYGRAIRDVRRITEPKGKWTKEFLNQYQMRLTKEQEINNPEAFVRTQLARGKTLGIGIQKWKQGIGYSAVLCFLLILAAVYGTYRYEQAQLLRYEYVLTGAGIFALLLLMKQFMGFMNKEDMILDGLLDYMENTLPARKPVPDEQALKEQTREELIDKVTEGIRQTAASETKFSHMLTPEEEYEPAIFIKRADTSMRCLPVFRYKLLFNHFNFQIIKIDRLNKIIGGKPGFIVAFKIHNIIVQPDRFAQIPEVTDLFERLEDLMGPRVIRIVADHGVFHHVIIGPYFSP